MQRMTNQHSSLKEIEWWEPVKDGEYKTQHDSCKIIVEGEWLSVKDDLYDVSLPAALPDDLRLCRRIGREEIILDRRQPGEK